jgi:hypothetical protein
VIEVLCRAADTVVLDKNLIIEMPFGEWEVSVGPNINRGEFDVYGFTFYLPGRTSWSDTVVDDGISHVHHEIEMMVDAWYDLLTVENKLCLSVRETESKQQPWLIRTATTSQPTESPTRR